MVCVHVTCACIAPHTQPFCFSSTLSPVWYASVGGLGLGSVRCPVSVETHTHMPLRPTLRRLPLQVQRAIFIRDNAREGSVKVRLDAKTQKSRKKAQFLM